MAARRLATSEAALAAGMAAIALGACGGHSPTRQDVIAQGNAICAGALRQMRAVPPPAGDITSPAALAGYLGQVIPIVERETSRLAALPRPPGALRATLDHYLAAVRSADDGYRQLAAAARAGDGGGVSQALATLSASPAPALAQRYGLTQCAQPAGTIGTLGSNG